MNYLDKEFGKRKSKNDKKAKKNYNKYKKGGPKRTEKAKN